MLVSIKESNKYTSLVPNESEFWKFGGVGGGREFLVIEEVQVAKDLGRE